LNKQSIVRVVIPALNEEEAVGNVIATIPKYCVDEIIVVDNNSKDATGLVAKKAGATVLSQPLPGYGNACLKGLDYVFTTDTDVVVFLDADHADDPSQLPLLLDKINEGYDLVIGSRALGSREKGSMTTPQVFGNWLATTLLNTFWGSQFTDLGPFRAITTKALLQIKMEDKNFGWTVEMQLKAAKSKLKSTEIPMNYRRRSHGVSKVSGSIKGSIKAGYIILYTIFRYL
jgi:glycosyltransferase involved in cell wall biosynthesis